MTSARRGSASHRHPDRLFRFKRNQHLSRPAITGAAFYTELVKRDPEHQQLTPERQLQVREVCEELVAHRSMFLRFSKWHRALSPITRRIILTVMVQDTDQDFEAELERLATLGKKGGA